MYYESKLGQREGPYLIKVIALQNLYNLTYLVYYIIMPKKDWRQKKRLKIDFIIFNYD